MAQLGVYFEIMDWLEQQAHLDPAAFLLKLQSSYRTGAVIYIDGVITTERLDVHRLVHSRPTEAARAGRLLLQRPLRDQLLRVFASLEPIEVDLDALAPRPARHPTNNLSGHSRIGIGYPLLSCPGRRACLLIQPSEGQANCPEWRRSHDRDILSLAGRFHARLALIARCAAPRDRAKNLLTRRERETLAWIAAGKSYWETSVILGISERTVRFFMANARDKLDVVNNAQAVAEAAWQGLIPRLSDSLPN